MFTRDVHAVYQTMFLSNFPSPLSRPFFLPYPESVNGRQPRPNTPPPEEFWSARKIAYFLIHLVLIFRAYD